MGQKIEITSSITIGDVAVFDTDRTLGGQDGERFRSVDEAEAGTTYPAGVAKTLLTADAGVKSVYVNSNVVSVERAGGWDDDALDQAGKLIRDFFSFYSE